MPNIDPEKSVVAARAAIEANLSNYQREARDFNGSDADTNRMLNDAFAKGMGPAPWIPQGGNGFGGEPTARPPTTGMAQKKDATNVAEK